MSSSTLGWSKLFLLNLLYFSRLSLKFDKLLVNCFNFLNWWSFLLLVNCFNVLNWWSFLYHDSVLFTNLGWKIQSLGLLSHPVPVEVHSDAYGHAPAKDLGDYLKSQDIPSFFFDSVSPSRKVVGFSDSWLAASVFKFRHEVFAAKLGHFPSNRDDYKLANVAYDAAERIRKLEDYVAYDAALEVFTERLSFQHVTDVKNV